MQRYAMFGEPLKLGDIVMFNDQNRELRVGIVIGFTPNTTVVTKKIAKEQNIGVADYNLLIAGKIDVAEGEGDILKIKQLLTKIEETPEKYLTPTRIPRRGMRITTAKKGPCEVAKK